MQNVDLEVELFKALAHPGRLQILDVLRAEPACVCHLTAVLNRPQPYISQQVAVLRDAGLVIDEKEGVNVFYRVRDQGVYDLIDRVRAMLRSRAPDPEEWRPGTAIPVTLAACPCPKCHVVAA